MSVSAFSTVSSKVAAKADPSHLIAFSDMSASEKKKALQQVKLHADSKRTLAELDQIAERHKEQLNKNEKKQGDTSNETVNEHGDTIHVSDEARTAYRDANTSSQDVEAAAVVT
jgi:hypothetical protein